MALFATQTFGVLILTGGCDLVNVRLKLLEVVHISQLDETVRLIIVHGTLRTASLSYRPFFVGGLLQMLHHFLKGLSPLGVLVADLQVIVLDTRSWIL
jgi:hypothetical protein